MKALLLTEYKKMQVTDVDEPDTPAFRLADGYEDRFTIDAATGAIDGEYQVGPRVGDESICLLSRRGDVKRQLTASMIADDEADDITRWQGR